MFDSPGKRKYDAMEDNKGAIGVKELIGLFEVGIPTKGVKIDRGGSCIKNQPHSRFKFGTGKNGNFGEK